MNVQVLFPLYRGYINQPNLAVKKNVRDEVSAQIPGIIQFVNITTSILAYRVIIVYRAEAVAI